MLKPNRYKIKIENRKCRCVEANGQPSETFLSPDTVKKRPKLYVVKRGKEILYVGITKQAISSRLRYGMTAKGGQSYSGYSGYKWKDLHDVELFVWAFPNEQLNTEAVEGELVYFIRNRTGGWPKYQMEIHFHPGASEAERQAAQSILDDLLA